MGSKPDTNACGPGKTAEQPQRSVAAVDDGDCLEQFQVRFKALGDNESYKDVLLRANKQVVDAALPMASRGRCSTRPTSRRRARPSSP